MTVEQTRPPTRRPEPAPSVGEVADLVKAYAQQQTLGPLRGAGRWVGYGAAAAVALGLGLSLIVLGVLRLVQTEWDRAAEGSLSWLAYLIALIVCLAFLLLAVSRINRESLHGGSQ
jgi:hypothetical protein